MPQILIDTATETPTMLRRCAQFLLDLARDDSPDEDSVARADTLSPLPEGPLPPDDPATIFAGNTPPPPAAEFPGTATPPPPPPPPMSASTPAPAPTSAEWDSRGTVWDSRVHSTNKSKNENGTWRRRKNLPAGLYETVMAENAALHLASVSLPPGPTTSAMSVRGIPEVPVQPQPGDVPLPPPPPAGAVPPPPVSPPSNSAGGATPVLPGAATGIMTFKELMLKIGAGTQAGKYTQAMVEEACKRCGLENLTHLVAQPMLAPMVATMLDVVAAGR